MTEEQGIYAPGERSFDPSRYLMSISGKAYLPVYARILWLRNLHPDASIDTELVSDDGARAIVKARVTLPSGGSATGYGDESYQDFGDYLTKAETKAIGRAIGALGLGTAACDDYQEGEHPATGERRIVDAPVPLRRPLAATGGGRGDPATAKQVSAIYAIGRAGRLSDADIVKRSQDAFGVTPEQLGRRDASSFIDLLKQEFANGGAR